MGFFVFVIVHNFSTLIFPSASAIRHPQVSSPRFADTSFAGRFFELFTLPASLKLNTQRRSAPSMHAFHEEERSVVISVTVMKGITGYKTVPNIGNTFYSVCKWRVQPCDSDLKERFLSFVCLFIFFAIHISRFFCLTVFVIRIFFHPHFSIQPRPQGFSLKKWVGREIILFNLGE